MDIHPSQLRRVTIASVREILDGQAVPYAAIRDTDEAGVVRVDVTGLGRFRLAVARERVAQALDARRRSDFWIIHPAGVTYRWRPWRSFVTVRDPGTEWTEHGHDFLGNPTR